MRKQEKITKTKYGIREIVRKKPVFFLTMILTAVSFTACTLPFTANGQVSQQESTASTDTGRVDTGFVLTRPESYDSADTAILVEKNNSDNTVTFLNLELGKRYTLSIDGTTGFYDKFGEGISLNQIAMGDIVDITFLKSKKHLTTMSLSKEAWSYQNVERYELNTVRGEVTIGPDIYKLTENTQYLSEGRNIERMDLNAADVLSFQGLGNTILSINVEKGHGYLRLTNDENFVGGWIELGATVIRRITEDMLLTVPEGSYQANISHNGNSGIKSVIINRNEETTLDIGDIEVAEPQSGMVLFSLSPANTELYIDGAQVDPSQPITLEYGLHQLIARASGYNSITQYLRVGQESAGVDIVLDAIDTGSDESSSSSSSQSSSSTVDTTTNYYRVYIDAPEKAEVYLDGNYVGIAPCSFRKSAGSHVITLRRSGYETRSYTIQVDSEEKDISYSFADMVPGSSSSAAESSPASSESSSASSESSSASSGSSSSSAESSSASGT